MRRKRARLALVVITLAVASAACSSAEDQGSEPATASGDPLTDKLAQVLERGTLIAYWGPKYPPQSYAVPGADRATETRCADDELTAPEVTGFDVETAKLVAADLGVEPCFVAPTWTEVTAGNWNDRWDIAYGSGSINSDRMDRLWMTQPYYAVPNYYFVHEDSPFQQPSDLDGRQIGACASCSHELYLRGELEIPGVEIVPTVEDPEIVTYETEPPGIQEVADGKIDAFLAAGPVGQAAIDQGLPLRRIDEIAFTYYPSGFVDKGSSLDSAAFVERVDAIIQGAQADGRLLALSEEFFGEDYVAAAAAYDIAALDQEVT